MTRERTFVIVRAGLAGGKAAETLRQEGFDERVVLIATSSSDRTSDRRSPRVRAPRRRRQHDAQRLEETQRRRVAEAVAFAAASPPPADVTLARHVYADPRFEQQFARMRPGSPFGENDLAFLRHGCARCERRGHRPALATPAGHGDRGGLRRQAQPRAAGVLRRPRRTGHACRHGRDPDAEGGARPARLSARERQRAVESPSARFGGSTGCIYSEDRMARGVRVGDPERVYPRNPALPRAGSWSRRS